MHADRNEMTLRDYGKVVWRRKWIVVTATLVTVAVAIGLSAAQTPIYEATTRVLVEARSGDGLFDARATNLNERAIQTEIQVINGRAVRDRVAADLGLGGRTPAATARSAGNADVIAITVRSTNASNAATLANAYAQAYIDIRREEVAADADAARAELERAIDELQQEVDTLAEDDVRRTTFLTQLASFQTTLDQLRVDSALRSGGATVIREATVPSQPVEPTPRRTATVALMAGLLLGLGGAFLVNYLDDKIRTEEDLEHLTDQPVLTVVPIDPPPDNRPIAISEPSHDAVEAYRGLRTNLQFLGLDSPLKVIQVTSSLPGEGKTTTASNLAVVLAQAGHKVALVDADLRRPRIHEVFALFPNGGLTDLLLGAEPKDVVNHIEIEGGSRLSIYTAGTVPSNPSEMLSARRTRGLLNEMARHYDHVIVDSAPVLPVSDAVALAAAVDGLLVVAHAGRVTDTQVTETLERLERVAAPVLGLVLNQASRVERRDYSYGGYTADLPIARPDPQHPTTPVASTVDA